MNETDIYKMAKFNGDEDIKLGSYIYIASGNFDIIDYELNNLETRLKDLEYNGTGTGAMFSIDSFSNTVNVVEVGSTVNSVTFNWKVNRLPVALRLDDLNIDPNLSTLTIQDTVKSNKTYTLTAIDIKNLVATKTTSISFLNGIYYGASTRISRDIMISNVFKKNITNQKSMSFTVDAKDMEYIYFCLPTRLGDCIFRFGGFEGGFVKDDIVPFENMYGYVESYTIYRSVHTNLGNTTITVI